jgi:hypothetical protein
VANERSRPGNRNVRKGKRVGPDYPEELFSNPLNAEIETWYDQGEDNKALVSPNHETVTGVGLPLHKGKYVKYFEGK